MYRTLAAALLCALAIALPASARDVPTGLSSRLDAQLQANRERYGIAGQAVLVARNGNVLYQGASVGGQAADQHAGDAAGGTRQGGPGCTRQPLCA
ncbi:hypothetical protein G6F22_020360 [Rhizopus arrhizus]|nr:hypothetical protein G6F22_020360 [Rhizopus arrhizus]